MENINEIDMKLLPAGRSFFVRSSSLDRAKEENTLRVLPALLNFRIEGEISFGGFNRVNISACPVGASHRTGVVKLYFFVLSSFRVFVIGFFLLSSVYCILSSTF